MKSILFTNKKTWLGALFSFSLLIMVGLTFAFTNQKTEAKATKVQPVLYWYKISATGTLESQLNSVPQTKDDSMPDGSNPLTNCEDQVPGDCIRGYETEQSVGDPAPPAIDNDYKVSFSN